MHIYKLSLVCRWRLFQWCWLRASANEFIHMKTWYILLHLCPNINAGSVSLWYMLGHVWITMFVMTSSNGHIFHVTGTLCGEFTGHRWIPRTKASDAELWYFFYLRLILIQALLSNYDRLTAKLILGLHPANERRCYFVTTSLIGWAQA